MISGTTATAAAAGTFELGDRTVNRLGFGAMRLTGTGGMGLGEDRDPEHSAAVVRRAVELGVNHIDTAGFYFSATGRANVIIRDALAPYPDDLTIVTKVGPGRDLSTGDWGDWATPDQLRAHVEHNLETLGLDRLHVVNYRSNGRDDVPAAVAALVRLREEGLLDHVGLSNVGVEALDRRARRHRRSSACRTATRRATSAPTLGDVLAACRDRGHRVRPVLHHRRPGPGGVRRRSSTTSSGPSPRPTTPRPRRSGSPGTSRSDRTSWPSRAPVTSGISSRTSRPPPCA